MISQVKHVQGRVFDKLLRASGVEAFNGPQGVILYVLWQVDGLDAVTLSKRTGLAKTTLTSMLNRMERKALIRREADPADRRRMRVFLLDAARALEEEYLRISAQMDALYFEGFADSETKALESALERVLQNLERYA